MRSRHISIEIGRTPAAVYALARDPRRLPEWAAGLAAGAPTIVDDDELVVDSPMGRVRVRFVPRNALGVLDHEVSLPDGTTTANPLRVLAHPAGAEVVFTLRQLDPEVSAARFEHLLGAANVLVVVATRAGSDVGFALLTLRPTPYFDGPAAQLDELYVRPDLRAGGIGTRILARAVGEVVARNGREIYLNLDSVDSGARRFYERHGFSDRDPDSGSRMLCYLQQL